MVKICSACKTVKSTKDFHKCKKSKDGYTYKCKLCVIEYQKKYLVRRGVKQRIVDYSRKYSREHKVECVIARKKYRNKELTKEKRAIYGRQYRSRPNVKITERENGRRWIVNNRERHRVNMKRQYRERAKNPIFRMTTAIRVALCTAMKKQGASKGGSHWESLVGYTIEELRNHLESQFTKGMTWENYGKWHIDHIIPISFFQYVSPDDVEFKMCWRLENLRPLLGIDNIKKGNKLVA